MEKPKWWDIVIGDGKAIAGGFNTTVKYDGIDIPVTDIKVELNACEIAKVTIEVCIEGTIRAILCDDQVDIENLSEAREKIFSMLCIQKEFLGIPFGEKKYVCKDAKGEFFVDWKSNMYLTDECIGRVRDIYKAGEIWVMLNDIGKSIFGDHIDNIILRRNNEDSAGS